MVKVEMEYNPYLKESLIKFNGKSPRINSLVEKYDNELLQNWLDKLPSIFYDEMNGYDFELEFSGTELDYQDLKQQFNRIGVGDDLVHIFKKNGLAERSEKVINVDLLLKWLKENPNQNFNEEKFRFNNKDLFDETYSFIVFHGTGMDLKGIDQNEVSVEFINDRNELDHVNLQLTPILFYISENSIDSFQKDLQFVMAQPNVMIEQLFFLIDSSQNTDFVKRIIQDLGIQYPNIVSSLDELMIKKYMEVYPVTDYIEQSIQTFRKETDTLEESLMEKKKISEIKNRSVYSRLNGLEINIKNLKDSLTQFQTRSSMEIPEDWKQEKSLLLGLITNWRLRKTKAVGEDEIYRCAYEFEDDFRHWYDEFLENMNNKIQSTLNENLTMLNQWYRDAGYDIFFTPKYIEKRKVENETLIFIANDLLRMKKEEKVESKGAIFGKLFGTSDPSAYEPQIQTVCYYEDWRNSVLEKIRPIVENILQENFDAMVEYLGSISKLYEEHINELIDELTKKREEESSKLSVEEKILQDDIDWLTQFIDQVKVIERG